MIGTWMAGSRSAVLVIMIGSWAMVGCGGDSDDPTGPVDNPDGTANANSEMTVDLPGGATIDFVWIEPGSFTMGSAESETGRELNESPQREVAISRGFWLGKFETTQAQWESVMGIRPWEGQLFVHESPSHPAVYVSWDDVQLLTGRLNEDAGVPIYRLPTEAEWEYACRAGASTRWHFGDDEGLLSEYAWYELNVSGAEMQYAQPVNGKSPNAWGLHDMNGNVSEWCQDWYGGLYPAVEQETDPQGPSEGFGRIYRGGNYLSPADGARSATRDAANPDYRGYHFGFRLLRLPR